MADVARDCDAGICHAGAGTVEALVTAGKPLLLLPEHLEQLMTGKRIESIGAGLVVDPATDRSPNYARLLKRLLDEPAFTSAAEAVAGKYAGETPADRVRLIADRCEELMEGGRSK